jgi:hypothetical protein
MQQRLGVAAGLGQALEDQVAGGLLRLLETVN